MRIGILTGGGDVPGLNSCIKAIVDGAENQGWDIVGIRRGWAGLLEFDPEDKVRARSEHTVTLNSSSVRNIDRTGGTVLHTSRTNPSRVAKDKLPEFLRSSSSTPGDETTDCTSHVLNVLEALELDALIPIGGDDTLSYAARLHNEGVPIVAIPKTMDNDVFGTQYCIGFSTAVTRSVEFLGALRTPAGSHERIAIVELFGRNSGETALLAGHIAGIDRVLIPEVPFDLDRVAGLLAADRASNPANYAVCAVSEGAYPASGDVLEHGDADAFGHRKLGGIGAFVGQSIKDTTGIDVICQSLAYLMRAGPPDPLDKLVASSFGTMAVQHLADGSTGTLMALVDGNYTSVPILACLGQTRKVDVSEFYNSSEYRPEIRQLKGKPMFMY